MWKFNGQQRPSFALETSDGQESVWDYPRPPICEPETRQVIVSLRDTEIARSARAIRVLETASPPTVYLPQEDIRLNLLQRAAGSSFCEWKGTATYWSLVLPTGQLKNVGWSYDGTGSASSNDRFSQIRGYLSFYPALVDCFLGDEKVRPQPGGFYGGWVSHEIIGPYKGEPGTSGW